MSTDPTLPTTSGTVIYSTYPVFGSSQETLSYATSTFSAFTSSDVNGVPPVITYTVPFSDTNLPGLPSSTPAIRGASSHSTSVSSAAPTPTDVSVFQYATTLTAPGTIGQVITAQVNATTLTADATQSQVFTGEVTLAPSNATDVKSSGGLQGGPAAGLAVGMLVAGATIAAVVVIMWQKKKSNRRRPRKDHGFSAYSTGGTRDEKSGADVNVIGSQAGDFDLDRLFPQPFDDATVKSKVQLLFSQIDGHVDNFYIDNMVNVDGQSGDEMLTNPVTRLFRIKQTICRTMLESIGPDCPSDRSLLPYGYTTIARRLKEPNLNDHGKHLLPLSAHVDFFSDNTIVVQASHLSRVSA